MAIFNKDNNLAGKAKSAASRVMALSEEKLADLILKAVIKQDRVNAILQ